MSTLCSAQLIYLLPELIIYILQYCVVVDIINVSITCNTLNKIVNNDNDIWITQINKYMPYKQYTLSDRAFAIECYKGRKIIINTGINGYNDDESMIIYPWYTYKMLYKIIKSDNISLSYYDKDSGFHNLLNLYWEGDMDIPVPPEDGDKYLIDDDENYAGINTYYNVDTISY